MHWKCSLILSGPRKGGERATRLPLDHLGRRRRATRTGVTSVEGPLLPGVRLHGAGGPRHRGSGLHGYRDVRRQPRRVRRPPGRAARPAQPTPASSWSASTPEPGFVYPTCCLTSCTGCAGPPSWRPPSALTLGCGRRRPPRSRHPASDYDRLAAALDEVTDIAEAHGLVACYHPHLTTIVESPDELEQADAAVPGSASAPTRPTWPRAAAIRRR